MNLLNIITLITFAVAPGDPPTVIVSGNVATFQADFIEAYALPASVITVVQGVPLAGTNQLLASEDGVSPIVVTLPPGT